MAAQTETLLELRPFDGPEPGSIAGEVSLRHPSSGAVKDAPVLLSRSHRAVLTVQLSAINLLSSAVTGLITVGLPRIAQDLAIPQELFFWPVSVYCLTTASTLLLAGSVADIIGSRAVDLVGCFLLALFTLGGGLAWTGTQLVVFRAIQGVALSLHLTSSVSILSRSFPRGRGRNIAFSFLGLSQVLGFSVGLVAGGVLVDTIGWRAGWYMSGGGMFLLSTMGIWILPKPASGARRCLSRDLATKVDWIGAAIASAFMAMLSYLLAIISSDVGRIREGGSIALLAISVLTIPLFVYWVHRQAGLGRPALIPNRLWQNASFTSTCLSVFLSFCVLQSMEQYSSLYFQEIQQLPALQASIRILPSAVVGTVLNFTTGLLVDRFSAVYLVAISSLLCAVSPLLMAVANPELPYWYNIFFAQMLLPVSGDVIFTVGLVVISEVFPEDTQALAGAVFNTASQFGLSFGLAIMQVISTLTAKSHAPQSTAFDALLSGYRASFWTMFAIMISCFLLGAVGLRKAGVVGLKRD